MAKKTIKQLNDQLQTLNQQIANQQKFDETSPLINSSHEQRLTSNFSKNPTTPNIQPSGISFISQKSCQKLRYYQNQMNPTKFIQIKSIKRTQISKDEYIQFLEDFADFKCHEVNHLIKKLIGRIEGNRPETKDSRSVQDLREENARLRSEIKIIKSAVNQFVAKHRETKAARRTRELEELARIRNKYEQHNLDLYLFIANQFKDIVNIPYDIDEKSIRSMIKYVAKLASKKRRINCIE